MVASRGPDFHTANTAIRLFPVPTRPLVAGWGVDLSPQNISRRTSLNSLHSGGYPRLRHICSLDCIHAFPAMKTLSLNSSRSVHWLWSWLYLSMSNQRLSDVISWILIECMPLAEPLSSPLWPLTSVSLWASSIIAQVIRILHPPHSNFMNAAFVTRKRGISVFVNYRRGVEDWGVIWHN